MNLSCVRMQHTEGAGVARSTHVQKHLRRPTLPMFHLSFVTTQVREGGQVVVVNDHAHVA